MRALYLVAAAAVVVIGAGAGFYFYQHAAGPHAAPPAVARPALTAPASTAPASAPPPAAAVQPPADCLLPGPPPVPPNGAVASEADMKLAHNVIQAFVLQLEAYQACRLSQSDHAPATVTAARKQIWIEQGDAAIDEAHALADAFSAQLKAYHAKHP